MRKIFIDLSSDNYLQQPKMFGGYEGEHNETYLQVKLPKRMIDIECSGYRFDFQTSEGNEISSPLIPVSELEDDILSFHLIEQLTVAGKLIFTAVAVRAGQNTVDLISKTNTVILCIEDSPKGKVQLIDPNGYKDELLKMVDARILETSPPVIIDQTYNHESENAQSGKAIAEALEIKPGQKVAEQGEIFNNYTKNVANAKYSHAEGNITEANAEAAHTEGYKTKAINPASHAEGALTNAGGTSSHAEGYETKSLGYVSHSEGYKTEAVGHGSHAEGALTKAISDNAHAEGVGSIAGTKGFKITNIEVNDTDNTGVLHIIDGSNSVKPEDTEDIYDKPNDYVSDKVTECYAVGDLLNIDVDKHQYGKYKITTLQDGKIYFEGVSPFGVNNASDELILGSDVTDNYVWVEGKSFGGTIDQFSGTHAEGNYTTAIGWGSHSEGRNTHAIGNYSHAEGRDTTANYGAHAEGRHTTAKGHMSHAEGQNTSSNGECAHAEGRGTNANGYCSHAEGYATEANGNSSHTSGDHTIAGQANQFVVGRYNDNKEDTLFEVGYGYDESSRRNALEVLTDGSARIATQGLDDTSIVIYSTLIAESNNKPGAKSGNGEIFNNYTDNTAGWKAHAEGDVTKATGSSSHSEGYNTQAIGAQSHAEGRGTVAGQIQEDGTIAGTAAHAEGNATKATAYCAHSEGSETLAQHQFSHSGGLGTKTGRDCQMVIGSYNVGNTDTLFEVGCGSGNSDRKNVFEVYDDGSISIGGIKITPDQLTQLLALVKQ